MTFVRWHYRDGVYVRSHYRHVRSTPGDAQTTLIPAAAGPGSQPRRDPAAAHRPRANPRTAWRAPQASRAVAPARRAAEAALAL